MPDRELIELVQQVAAPLLPDQPWLGWLLVALCRQRSRQTWLVQVHEQHLSDVDELQGTVPDLPGWSYAYHGSGLCLTGPDGEAINLDFDGLPPPGSTIDPYFFAGRVRSLPAPQLPEKRLRRLLPASDLIAAALQELRRIGAVHHPTSRHVFRLAARLELHHQDIAAIDFASEGVRRRWSKALGDLDDAVTLPLLQRWLSDCIRSDRRHASLLRHTHGLLGPEQIQALARGILAGPIDSGAGRALDALRTTAVPPDPSVVTFLDRLDPSEHHPYVAHAAAAYLLDHGVERSRCLETIEAFARVEVVAGFRGNPYVDHLALLTLRHAPDRAWPLLRRAAHESTPGVYETIGAVLALLDDERAPRLLLEAALDSDSAQRRYLLACLAHRDDDASTTLAAAHMPAPPDRSSPHGFTFEEVQYASLRPTVERRLAKARQILGSLRTA